MAHAISSSLMYVPPLHWTRRAAGIWPFASKVLNYRSETPLGVYWIKHTTVAHYQVSLDRADGRSELIDVPTRELGLAYEIAQAHYERRALSVFESVTTKDLKPSGQVCINCGSTRTESELDARRKSSRTLLSCCTDRHAVPVWNTVCVMVPDDEEPEYHYRDETQPWWLEAAE
jgi:hypothetical protein